VASGLWDKAGIGWSGIKAGENADMWSPNTDFSPAAWAKLQSMLDRVYGDFTGKVADGRKLPLAQVLEAAKGQVWSGEDAQALGLVDALGGLYTARDMARQAAGIAHADAVRFKIYPEERDPFEALLERALSGEMRSPALTALARSLTRAAQALAPVLRAIETLSGQSSGPLLRAPDVRPAG